MASVRVPTMVAVPVPGPKVATVLASPVEGLVLELVGLMLTGPLAFQMTFVPAGRPSSRAITETVRVSPSKTVRLVGPTGSRVRSTGAVTLTV